MPPAGTEGPADEAQPEKQGLDAPTDDEGPEGHSRGQQAYQRALPESRQEKQPRITVSVRLGTDPRCRTTPKPKAVLVCSFPVAEKREGFETPNWLTVVAFKALAAKVQDTRKKGMFVDVVGYEHDKTRKSRDGKVRHDKEISAVAIRHR